MDLGKGGEDRGPELPRCVAGAVNAEHHALLLGGLVDGIVVGLAESDGQPRGEDLETLETELVDRAPELLGGLLRRPHGQDPHAAQPVRQRVVLLGEVRVGRLGRGNLVRHLLVLGDVARARGETDGHLHVLVVHERMPAPHLLLGGKSFPVHRHLEALEQVRVPRLVSGPQGRPALVPGRLQVFANVRRPFENMPIRIDTCCVAHGSYLLVLSMVYVRYVQISLYCLWVRLSMNAALVHTRRQGHGKPDSSAELGSDRNPGTARRPIEGALQ